MVVAIKFRRMSEMIVFCCSAPNPGAMPISARTICSAKMAIKTEATAVIKKAKFAMREKSFHASGLPRVAKYSLKIGMSAIDIAPPEMSAKSISGRLLATLKASSSKLKLNCRAMMIERKKASPLSSAKNPPIRKDVRVRKESFFIESV